MEKKENKKYEVNVFRCDIRDKKPSDVYLFYKLEYIDNNNTIKDLFEHVSGFSKSVLCPCFLKLSEKNPPSFDNKNNIKNLLGYEEKSLLSELKIKNSITIYYLAKDNCKCGKKKQYQIEEIKKELEEKKKENEEIKNDNKKNINKISELNEKIKELDLKIKELELKIKELELKIKELEEKYKNKENIEKELNEEIKKLNEENKKLKNDNVSFQEIIKNKGLLENENFNDNNQIKIDPETLKIKENKNIETINKNINVALQDFYDIIINIRSVKDISKGWEIKMTQKGEENFNKYKNSELIKIGVIGNSN